MRLEASPVPGVVPMVRELRGNGTALAVATCASRKRAVSTLTELGSIDCFPVIVAGEDVVFGKPDAAIYRLACTRIPPGLANSLAVEDAIEVFVRPQAQDCDASELHCMKPAKACSARCVSCGARLSISFWRSTWNVFLPVANRKSGAAAAGA